MSRGGAVLIWIYRLRLGVKPGDSRYYIVPTPLEIVLQVGLVAFLVIGGPVVAGMAALRGDGIAAVGVLVTAFGGAWFFAVAKETIWLCRVRIAAPGRPEFLVRYRTYPESRGIPRAGL